MIIPDINLLVFAYNEKALHHKAARSWWEGCLNETRPIGLSWIVINGFLRLMTHSKVLRQPMSIHSAVECVESWLHQPSVSIINPGKNFSSLFFMHLRKTGAGGNLTTDAYLAALALQYEAELHSNDTDFSRFTTLRWKNPLNLKT